MDYLQDNNTIGKASHILQRGMNFTTSKNFVETQVKKTKQPVDSSNYSKYKRIVAINKDLVN